MNENYFFRFEVRIFLYEDIYFTNDINVINKFKRISTKISDYDNNIEIILNNLSYRPVKLFLLRIFYIILYYFI